MSDAAPPARPLAEQAYAQLFERIRECELRPRQLVSERTLAAELGLGLAPVRAALARLAAEGILIAKPRVGYEVRGFGPDDVDAFFVAWRILAPQLVGLASERADAARRAEWHRVADEARDQARSLAPGRDWVHVAERVFDAIIGGVDNAFLERFYRELRFDMHRLFILTLEGEGAGVDDFGNLELILDSEPDAARGYVEAFVDEATRRVLAWAERSSEGDAAVSRTS